MCNGYIRWSLSLVLMFLVPAWGQAEPSIKENEMRTKIYISEPIKKIQGTKWPRHSDGTIPLVYSIPTPCEFELIFGNNSIIIKGANCNIKASQQHIVKTASVENIFNTPLPFDEAKQATIAILSNLNIQDESLIQSVKEWQPIDLPPNNDVS